MSAIRDRLRALLLAEKTRRVVMDYATAEARVEWIATFLRPADDALGVKP